MKPQPTIYTDFKAHHPYDLGYALSKAVTGKDVVVLMTSNKALTWEHDFLEQFPEEQRPFWDCTCCRHFFEKYATLVAIGYNEDEDGVATDIEQINSIWRITEDTPEELRPVFAHLQNTMEGARPLAPFTNELTARERKMEEFSHGLGAKDKGGYQHFHIAIPDNVKALDTYGTTAVAIDAHIANLSATIARFMQKYNGDVDALGKAFTKAVTLLDFSAKASGKVKDNGVVTIRALQSFLTHVKTKGSAFAIALLNRSHFYRLYHFNGSSIGTYLNDLLIEEKDPVETVNFFVHMTDPEYYQRAQVEASEKDMDGLIAMMETKGYVNAFNYSWVSPNDVPYIHDFRRLPAGAVEGCDKPLSSAELLKQKKEARFSVAEAEDVFKAVGALKITFDTFFTEYAARLTKPAVRIPVGTNLMTTLTFVVKLNVDPATEPSPMQDPITNGLYQFRLRDPAIIQRYGITNTTVPLIGTVDIGGSAALLVTGKLTGTLQNVGAPLFATLYNGDFYPHRRAMELSMDMCKPTGTADQDVVLALPRYQNLQVSGIIDGVAVVFELIELNA